MSSESNSKCTGADILAKTEAEADLGGSGAREVGEAARDEFWDLFLGPAKYGPGPFGQTVQLGPG